MATQENTDERIVFPDEVEEIKAEECVPGETTTETNSNEEPPAELSMRNMIVAPPNCPDNQTMGSDGVCRDVF